MPQQDIVTISHYSGGIRIQRGQTALFWSNVEMLAESHAYALARLDRYERIEGGLVTLHKELSDAIGRASTDGADFVRCRDMMRDLLAQ